MGRHTAFRARAHPLNQREGRHQFSPCRDLRGETSNLMVLPVELESVAAEGDQILIDEMTMSGWVEVMVIEGSGAEHVVVRRLEEADLPEADRISRIAF